MNTTSRLANTSAIANQSNCRNATVVLVSWSRRAIIVTPMPVNTSTQHMTDWSACGWNRSSRPQAVRNSAPTNASIHT